MVNTVFYFIKIYPNHENEILGQRCSIYRRTPFESAFYTVDFSVHCYGYYKVFDEDFDTLVGS